MTEQMRLRMLKLYLSGMSIESIAERFSVTKQYPSLLAKRRGHPVRQENKTRHAKVGDGTPIPARDR